ncbi:MAG: type IV pilus twitching motility protein PilT [Bdellovibrionaceae bacterium]|nr:type IV pilus twitching motility protein PilT [Pseudobdellovibrionaceae bacterium]
MAAKLDELFKLMVKQGASDLHLTTGAPPCLRIDGEIEKLDYRDLTSEECKALIVEILNDEQKHILANEWDLDCAYQVPALGRFRCNIFFQRKGLGAVFRHIPETIKTMEELNLPKAIGEIIGASQGLILVTGPTGSGKSTTLAAMINELNEKQKLHILTLEDPIEFVHPNKKSLLNQREVHTNTKSFAGALKAALREDPDVILVGEMRDPETIGLALKAAETGHLVFGTLHTMSAPKTIDRIIDSFPQDEQPQVRTMLSESLKAVISQVLLPKANAKGRVAAHEILVNNMAIGNLIRENRIFQIKSTMQTGRAEGMQTMDDCITKLMQDGLVSIEVGKSMISKGLSSANSNQMGGSAPGQPALGRPGIPTPSGVPTGNPLASGFPGFGKKTS